METVFITICHMPGPSRYPRAFTTLEKAKAHCDSISDHFGDWLETLDDITPRRNNVTNQIEMSIYKTPIK